MLEDALSLMPFPGILHLIPWHNESPAKCVEEEIEAQNCRCRILRTIGEGEMRIPCWVVCFESLANLHKNGPVRSARTGPFIYLAGLIFVPGQVSQTFPSEPGASSP